MNETEAIAIQLDQFCSILTLRVDRLANALEELQRTTLLLLDVAADATGEAIDAWLDQAGFDVDEDGFFQSIPLRDAFRAGKAPVDAISVSWGKHLKDDPTARRHLFAHRAVGPLLKHIHDRLREVGWIYYQDAGNTALQYPYIDQCTAIAWDFDWSQYHTFLSAGPQQNPGRDVCWTAPTIDYAGEGIILSISLPVWRRAHFLGLWSIDVPLHYLSRQFIERSAVPAQEYFAVNEQGLLILHEKVAAEIDSTKGSIYLHSIGKLGGDWASLDIDGLPERGEFTMRDAEGVELRVCHRYVPCLGWTLFGTIPARAMEAAASRRVQNALHNFAEGNLGARSELEEASDLLAPLAREFNTMAQRLEDAEQARVRAEDSLRQAQKLESVGRLAGGVAHDFNNMLMGIMNYAELCRDKLEPDHPIREWLNEITLDAERSTKLTHQLLAFARKQIIAPKIIDLTEAIGSMLKLLRRLIGEDVTMTFTANPDTWPVKMDPVQVDQILANLCVNARDAIGGVGSISIETSNATFDAAYCADHPGSLRGDYALLTVTDSGCGMDKETLKNIFEPFFTTKGEGEGTGLGLATVYGIVKQNNGFINVYSEPGQGTTFKIYLPRVVATEAAQAASAPAAKPPHGTETVLLVEDEKSIRITTEIFLKDLGYTVLVAEAPEQALHLAAQHAGEIDLLITDVIMPGMSGRDLANRLLELRPGIKRLFISGFTADVIAQRGILDDGVNFLSKPFGRDALAHKVREVLGTSHAPAFAVTETP